jgi:NitT/TauT family transport system ATP-binding protein
MLDEPFGALDQFTREELWSIMQELWLKLRPTVLRICVMRARPGQIIDDAEVQFPRPRTIEMSYTPDFVGMTQRLRQLIVSAKPSQEAA